VATASAALETSAAAREQQAALAYLVTVSPEGPVNDEWVRQAGASPDPARRVLAANAIGLRTHDSGGALRRLLDDPDPHVAAEACRAAGKVGDRIYFDQIAQRLADHSVRGSAIESLAVFGARVCGSLGDILLDANTPLAVRRQIPRVLRLIRDQRSVDVLAGSIGASDLSIRLAAVKALNRLRESAPDLLMPKPAIQQQLQAEARHCFELHSYLAPLRAADRSGAASSLLVRTLDNRVRQTMERLFRLLGLLYPPNEIYNAFVALESGVADRVSPAHDFLDSLLSREIKHVVMPLLDSRDRLVAHARDLCHIAPKSVETALRELLASGDSWITMCAIAAAAEMKLKGLAGEIAKAGESAGQETVAVAKTAVTALA
jgi:HEAT repeat protein